jgi:tRNA-Thr(GGU) m(6)t(6)A37 methyltransferase TsaA
MKKIIILPIGIIHTPYKKIEEIPIQGNLKKKVEAWVELKDKYVNGLKDLENFSHAILLFYFHKSKIEKIQSKPYLEDTIHGIFSIRSPNRPNHIGFSIVKIKNITNNKLYFNNVDMLDGTPLIDIKPYVEYFDNKINVCSGWIEKHFKNNIIN